MANTLIIRRAGESDIAVIRHLAHTIWPAVYDPIIGPAQVQYMLNLFYNERAIRQELGKGQVFLLGLSAETPAPDPTAVAYASFQPDRQAGVYRVPKLYVSASLRGRGIGQKMLDAIAAEVVAAGGGILRLNVNRHNPALQFYIKYGFTTVGSEDIAIGAGYFMNDFVMEKRLV